MSNPTAVSDKEINMSPSRDAFQLKNSVGAVVGWISGTGVPQGTLSASGSPAVVIASDFSGADAFAQINAAIATLPSTGGTVDARAFVSQSVSTQMVVSVPCHLLFGDATFTYVGPDKGTTAGAINITSSDVTFEGQGYGTVFTQGNAANIQTLIHLHANQRVIFKSLCVNGNESNQTNTGGFYTGIRSSAGAADVSVLDCKITASGTRGLDLRGTTRVQIRNNYFYQCGVNIAGQGLANGGNACSVDVDGATRSTDVFYIGNVFEQWGDSAISVTNALRGHVIGNTLRGQADFGLPFNVTQAGIDASGSVDVEIIGNTIRNVRGANIAAVTGTVGMTTYPTSNIRIVGNEIFANVKSVLDSIPVAAIGQAGVSSQCLNYTVTGNTFYNTGLSASGIDGLTVTGNNFHYDDSDGSNVVCIDILQAAGGVSKNISIIGNMFSSSVTNPTHGINIHAQVTTPQAITLSPNIFSGIASPVVWQSGSTNVALTGYYGPLFLFGFQEGSGGDNVNALPAATNAGLYLVGEPGTPNPQIGNIYVGDGSGKELDFNSRTSSADTVLFKMKDNGNFVAPEIILTGATPTVTSGQLGLGVTTAATANAGSATLPANPVGFLTINLGGTVVKIPYYAT